MKEEILERLRKVIEKAGEEAGKVTLENAHLWYLERDKGDKNLDLDSLDLVELSLAVEEEFKIEISDEDLKGVATVLDTIKLVEKKLEEKEDK